ncbi:hypothetical protein ACQPZF_10620 [Actinosynnema sp. CS-041913]|uniref:hypothetical protein n=1 Tax=Actinosynnema sp. CS-041913 TaxID=3239917 RepID=UPI003D905F9B
MLVIAVTSRLVGGGFTPNRAGYQVVTTARSTACAALRATMFGVVNDDARHVEESLPR